jgi:hypothetical protein
MTSLCILCQHPLDKLQASFVTYSRSGDSTKCSHCAHLSCIKLGDNYTCPVCSSKGIDADLGISAKQSRISALAAMKVQMASNTKGVLSSWLSSSDSTSNIKKCLAKFPAETLAHHSLVEFIDAGVTFDDILTHATPQNVKDVFTNDEILELKPSAQNLSTLMRSGLFEFTPDIISHICTSVDELTAIGFTPSKYVEKGFGLDQWIRRGATLGDVLKLHGDNVRFSEFVSIWHPTLHQLTSFNCFDTAALAEITDWKEQTVKSYAVTQRRNAAPSVRAMFPSELAFGSHSESGSLKKAPIKLAF